MLYKKRGLEKELLGLKNEGQAKLRITAQI